jgi:hypothetical protein
MARLQADMLERAEALCDRVLDVGEHLRETRRAPRIVSQVMGCGSSVGANLFAPEILSFEITQRASDARRQRQALPQVEARLELAPRCPRVRA